MLTPTATPFRPRVLLVDDDLAKLGTALGRAAESLAVALEARNVEYLRQNRPGDLLNAAYESLPDADMSPREAYDRLVAGDVEAVPVEELAKRTAANAVMPYPPGVPMLMSGENFGGADSPQIGYLRGVQSREQQFPGFAGVIEGAELKDGTYHVLCVKR